MPEDRLIQTQVAVGLKDPSGQFYGKHNSSYSVLKWYYYVLIQNVKGATEFLLEMCTVTYVTFKYSLL